MRVSNQLRHNTYLSDLNQRLENLYRLQRELSTGHRLRFPSDDPTEASHALRLETCLKRQEQFISNIEDAKNWTCFADSRLQSIVDLMTEIDSIAIRADNDDQTEEDRQGPATWTGPISLLTDYSYSRNCVPSRGLEARADSACPAGYRPILVYCQVGQRGYHAVRVPLSLGRDDVVNLGGGYAVLLDLPIG